MFGIGKRGTAVQEKPAQPVQQNPGDGHPAETPQRPPESSYRQPEAVTTYERPVSPEPMPAREETIHSSSFLRRLVARVLEYTGITLVLSEVILVLRLAFQLSDASVTNGFVSWILVTSGWMVKPFQGIFSDHLIRGGGTFEPATYIAMAVYLVGGLIILTLIGGLVSMAPRRMRRVRYVD